MSHDVFLRRTKPPKAKGLNVGMTLDHERVVGDVGLEIEVEGLSFPKTSPWVVEYNAQGTYIGDSTTRKKVSIPKQWRYTKDHSLRGRDNAEYVLRKPIAFDEVPAALDDLWKMFKDCNSQLDESNRTSVHVHVNVQEWYINRLTSFMTMYYVLEEILTQWCGEHRVGNLFCLSLKDAPGIMQQVQAFIASDGKVRPQDNLHYAGMSFYAIQKFGSLEFRTLRGVSDPKIIEDWVTIIRRLYDHSANFPDPRVLVETFSSSGPLGWFENVLGDAAKIVRDGLPNLDDEAIRNSMYENIRIAQDLCYCRDWDNFEALNIKADPFGRRPAKVVQSLQAFDAEGELQSDADISDLSDFIDEDAIPDFETATQAPPAWTFATASGPPSPQPTSNYPFNSWDD